MLNTVIGFDVIFHQFNQNRPSAQPIKTQRLVNLLALVAKIWVLLVRTRTAISKIISVTTVFNWSYKKLCAYAIMDMHKNWRCNLSSLLYLVGAIHRDVARRFSSVKDERKLVTSPNVANKCLSGLKASSNWILFLILNFLFHLNDK